MWSPVGNDESDAQRIVVTGAGGISSAVIHRCVTLGARVHVLGIDPEQLRSLARSAPGITTSVADLRSDEETHHAFKEAEEALGHIDGFVGVAGGSARSLGDGPVDGLSASALLQTIEMNLVTASNPLREVIRRHLDRSDRPPRLNAVLIGSVLGNYPASPHFATHGYAAAKAALVGLARTTAGHYATHGVSVNVVAPGLTRTPMAARAMDDTAVSGYARRRQPLSSDGFIDPEEVANACAWLLSARSVTGQVIGVDGGWSVFGG